MKNIVLLSSLCLLFLSSCVTTKTKKPSYDTTTLKTSWILQNEDQAELGLSDEPLTIVFDEEEANAISGFAGCNYYGGNYSITQNSLDLSEIYATKRACPAFDVETEYLKLLNQVDNFEIKGNNLYLYRGKLLLLHFKK